MNIIVVGAGQLGYFLVKNLLEAGHDVKVIEIDKKRCEKVACALDMQVLCSDGTRIEALANAACGKCDVFIAVTNRDEDNLIACEIAKKQFKVPRTISKSNNPKNISLMKRLGIDIVIDTTQIITTLLEREIDGSQVQFVADVGNSDAVISEYKIPFSWKQSGKKVSELEMPADCVLVYLKRNGIFMIPRGNTVIMGGDEVTALTIGKAGRKLKQLFGI
ncbi:MAG: TrkA family potassium uptake protein [Ruminococcus sp.]|nr:TrkA family potassium uptake protein [Ruminococcus sp.]